MVCGVKDKIMSLFIINTTKSYNIPTHVNNIYGDVNQQKRNRNKKQLIDNIIKNVRHLLRLKKKTIKKRIIKDIIKVFLNKKNIIINQ